MIDFSDVIWQLRWRTGLDDLQRDVGGGALRSMRGLPKEYCLP